MATLKEKINQDLVSATKAKDNLRVTTLRLLNSAIHNLEIDKRWKSEGKEVALTDDDILGVLRNEAKKRNEALSLFRQGKREDLVQKEEQELKIIEEYLPSELSEEEVKKMIEEVIAEIQPKGPSDFGRVMGEVMKRLKGRAEAPKVVSLVRDYLTKISE